MEYNANCMVVKSTGMHTSLGTSLQAAAAYRCSMSREKELKNLPYFDSAEYQQHFVKAHSAMESSEGFQGIARLIILGATALADLQNNAAEIELDTAKTGLFLCFPEYFEMDPTLEVVGYEVEEFVQRLVEESQVNLNIKNMEVFYDGITGVATALEQAHRALLNGKYDQCIVGSIDSLLLQSKINQLLVEDEIKTADNTYGLVPGEASCFVLLETLANARRNNSEANLTIIAYSRQTADTNKPDAEQNNSDEQAKESEDAQLTESQQDPERKLEENIVLQSKLLTEAITETTKYLQQIGGSNGVIYSDLNGQQQKVMAFSNGLIRAHGVHQVEIGQWKLETPAVNFGDTGTSNVLLSLILACNASKKKLLAGKKALIVATEDYGSAVTIGVGA